ncbi:hypothetical protein Y919_10475 [Caloranaerobacter azorensis H53214]|uniref:Uncharacterized protein n=1 Tax=Caloranaerobacter azorensis H53214 TaxID=1156417 RepID=A0A096BG36_9FIRM|nr:hypothetical protein [Caloranaerobacter azorensis]KGG79688.1 hypothetical protein Y919_10475 [Caloranaerobacter azorensis H53214]
MKKMLILPLILGLLIPGATTVNAQSFDNGSDPEIHPYYVVYCPGDSPDGKHHYFSASRNYSLTLWDANKNPIGTWWGFQCDCEYCGHQIWVSLDETEYINVDDITATWTGDCYAYESDIQPVDDQSMVLFR